MGFVNPFFLLAFTALGAPILMHLLLRNRPERQILPTLRFLPVSAQQSISMHRFKNILLLLLRLLILILIVLAFARPFFPRTVQEEEAGTGVDNVIVFALDTSLSMRAGDYWQVADNRIRTLLRTFKGECRYALLTFDRNTRVACPETDSPDTFRNALTTCTPGYGGTDLLAAIHGACELAASMEGDQKRVFLVTDFQRTGFRQLSIDLGIPEGVELVPVRVGEAPIPNLSIVSAEEHGGGEEGHNIRVRLSNHGTETADARVEVVQEDTILAERDVTIQHDGATIEDIAVPLPRDREHVLLVRLKAGDALTEDNELAVVLPAHRPLEVLFCAESSGVVLASDGPAMEAPSWVNPYLAAAVDAFGERVTASWTGAGQVTDALAKDWSLVVAEGPEGYPEPSRAALLEYVESGGKLVLFPGSGDIRALSGFYGAEVSAWTALDAQDGEYRLVSSSDFPGRLAMLNDTGDVLLGHPRAYRYLAAVLEAEADAVKPLLRFDNAMPFLLEHRAGAGAVYAFTTPLDPEATDFVLRAAFSPFLYQLFLYGVEAARPKHEYLVGEAFSEASALGGDWRITGPGDTVFAADNRGTPFEAPGAYTLHQGAQTRNLVAQLDPEESDLALMDEARIDLLAQAGEETGARGGIAPSALMAAEAQPDARFRLWWYLLLAAVCLMAVESLVAARTSR